MKRHNNGISEEHIVAYLDGELNVNGEMREALGDNELRHVAKEYATLKKVFARSASESRFLLNKSSDARARAFLQNVLHGNKMAPDAEAIPLVRPQTTRTKMFWAKRSALGFALALFLGALWFTLKPTDGTDTPVIVSAPPVQQDVQPSEVVPTPTTPQPMANITESPASQQQVAANTTQAVAAKRTSKRIVPAEISSPAPPVEKDANIVANQQEEQPADIMISRRYAKLIKNVRVVEITQQDKM